MLTLTILCLFLSLAQALPLLSRDVVDPPITSPTASTVWQVGQTVTVTWDTSSLANVNLTNPNGMVVLGWMANPDDSEHLMLDNPLAKDFPLTAGKVSFAVPSVVTRTNYIVVLFGDSGNISPTFTIQGTAASSTSASSSASSAASSASASSTAAVTSSAASASAAQTSSVTNIVTSVITATSSSSSVAASTASVLTPSISVSSSATSSSSAVSTSASSAPDTTSNAAWTIDLRRHQVYAFVMAGLVAACLL